MEMSYLRGPCGVTGWDDESNENMYERCGMGSQANGVKCGEVEWVKRNTLRWFGYIERMGSEEFVKKAYVSDSVGSNSRGRPPGRWRGRGKECMCDRGASRRGGLDQARSVWTGRGGSFSSVTTPLGDVPGERAMRQSYR